MKLMVASLKTIKINTDVIENDFKKLHKVNNMSCG